MRRNEFELLLMDITLQTHLTFGTEFSEAVEAKQVAQQEAERARYLVEKVGLALPCDWWSLMDSLVPGRTREAGGYNQRRG